MAMKTNTIETNERERHIFATAKYYVIKVGADRTEYDDEEAARDAAEWLAHDANRGATLYAVADVSGVDAGALLATYRPGKGWKESDR